MGARGRTFVAGAPAPVPVVAGAFPLVVLSGANTLSGVTLLGGSGIGKKRGSGWFERGFFFSKTPQRIPSGDSFQLVGAIGAAVRGISARGGAASGVKGAP